MKNEEVVINGKTFSITTWNFLEQMKFKRKYLKVITTAIEKISAKELMSEEVLNSDLSSIGDSVGVVEKLIPAISVILDFLTEKELDDLIMWIIKGVSYKVPDAGFISVARETLDDLFGGQTSDFYVLLAKVIGVNFGDILGNFKALTAKGQ